MNQTHSLTCSICSIGDKSGDLGGQLKTSTPASSKKCIVEAARMTSCIVLLEDLVGAIKNKRYCLHRKNCFLVTFCVDGSFHT